MAGAVFSFSTAGRIVFGAGAVKEAAPAAAAMGKRIFLVTGRDAERSRALQTELAEREIAVTVWSVSGEPTIPGIAAALQARRAAGCDCVVGFGGGSVLDSAKAVAALAEAPGGLLDYVEMVGKGKAIPDRGLPCIAIPTTAGTGSEVTRNAVLLSPEHRVKVSLRGPTLLPAVAIVDPELTVGLPPALTASTGLDALTQLIEPFVCCRANAFTDMICREGMARAAGALRRACHHPNDRPAREEMALASLFGGLALANAGLGAAHAFASPVGGRFGAPHGAICGALLAPTMEANLRAARRLTATTAGVPVLGGNAAAAMNRNLSAPGDRAGNPGRPIGRDGPAADPAHSMVLAGPGAATSPAQATVARYGEIAKILAGRTEAAPEDGIAWVRTLVAELGVPPLRTYGATELDAPLLAKQAAATSSMKANPLPLSEADLEGLFRTAL